MPEHVRAVIREIDSLDAEDVLRRNDVGRIAFLSGGEVFIEPIHFAWDEGAVYGRTAPGAKLSAVQKNPIVAFEVDEVSGRFDWRSVVVRGPFYRIPQERGGEASPVHRRALQLLRRVVPATLTEYDPTPDRTVFFRIVAKEITGRASRAVEVSSEG